MCLSAAGAEMCLYVCLSVCVNSCVLKQFYLFGSISQQLCGHCHVML